MAKGKSDSNGQRRHAPVVSDPRFARAQNDPRFLKPKKEAFQVVLDDRFKDLLQPGGEGQARKAKVDKYGRRIARDAQSAETQRLKSLYRLEEDERDSDEQDDDDEDFDEEEAASDDLPAAAGPSLIDYARGEAELESSSDDDSSDEEDDDELPSDDDYSSVDEDELRATTAQQPQAEAAARAGAKKSKDTELRGERTRRLAVVNMDWDHIRARDLYMVFSSLVSPTATRLPASVTAASDAQASANGRTSSTGSVLQVRGKVLSVRVYPSEFGRERMKKEDIEGPPKEIFKSPEEAGPSTKKKKHKKKKGRDDDSDEEEITAKSIIQVDEGGDFDEEALRKYQLERLRYYYAVATFDSVESASHVYNEIDGTEMERSANVFDLRFVPDEMEFPSYPLAADEPGKEDGYRDEVTYESVTSGLVSVAGDAGSTANGTASGAKYRPLDFKTDALRHSRVKLTWDADDPERTRITKNIFAPASQGKKAKKGKKNAPGVLTLDQMRDEDFKAYLASGTEDEDEEENADGEQGSAGRERLRALLNLDGGGEAGNGSDAPPNRLKAALNASNSVWGRSRLPDAKSGLVEGDMEITFTPGLSEAKGRKDLKNWSKGKAGGDGEEDGEETTLDKYKRKQREKKERRMAERSKAAAHQASDDEGANEEGGGDLGFDDPFFDNDADVEQAMAAALAAHDAGEPVKAAKKSARSVPSQAAHDEEGSIPPKSKTMSKREAKLERKRKRKAKLRGEEYVAPGQDDDSGDDDSGDDDTQAKGDNADDIDVSDPRFSAVLEDHRFALDPSHKAWKETKGMRKLVEERRKKARRE